MKGWIDPEYATKLRETRTQKGLTQKLVAERVGLSAQYYNDIEHGRRRPSEHNAEQIGKVLGVAYETPRERDLRRRIERAHTLLQELRRVVWAGQFGIPAEETTRLQREIDAVCGEPQRDRTV